MNKKEYENFILEKSFKDMTREELEKHILDLSEVLSVNYKIQDKNIEELERYKNIIDKAKKLCEDSWGSYYWECGNGYEDMMNILEGKELKGE